MKRAFIMSALCLLIGTATMAQEPPTAKFTLQELGYPLDALEPSISARTMELHWGKHLKGYVDNLNQLIAGTKFESEALEQIVKGAEGSIFNNAGQIWNHNFYFATFSPTPRKTPQGGLANAINKQFGSFDGFKSEFSKAASGLFGSGWVWLVKKADGTLAITTEPNAGNPLRGESGTALLGADVWEHAYYLDYQNRKADHIAKLWDIIDWAVVEGRFSE